MRRAGGVDWPRVLTPAAGCLPPAAAAAVLGFISPWEPTPALAIGDSGILLSRFSIRTWNIVCATSCRMVSSKVWNCW